MSAEAAHASSATWQARRDPMVWSIFGLYFALAVTYSYVMELGYGCDETGRHYPYVQWLAEQRCLPPADPTVDCGALELHPPLYYLVLTPVYAAFHGGGNRAALRALRWTSPFLVGLAMLLWFSLIRHACGNRRGSTLFAFALTAAWPHLHVDSGALNNDVGAIVVSAAIAWLLCFRVPKSQGPVSGVAVFAGLLVGAGGLIKSSVLVTGLPLVLLALAWQSGRRFFTDRDFWGRAVTVVVVTGLSCGWWYWRNLQLQGALIPVPKGYCLLPPTLTKFEALAGGYVGELFLRALHGLWLSTPTEVSWVPPAWQRVVYGCLSVPAVLAVVGGVRALGRVRSSRVEVTGLRWRCLLIPGLGFLALLASCIWAAIFVHAGVYQGGRYLMPFLPGLTVPLTLGLRNACPRRLRVVGGALVVALFLALNLVAWYHLTTYWNPLVLSTAGRFQ